MTKEIVDSRKFVTAWMQCDTVDDVAHRLKLTRPQVSAKANTLRKRGVKLPKKLRGAYTTNVTVDELNQIVDKYSLQVSKPVKMEWPKDMAYQPAKNKRVFARK